MTDKEQITALYMENCLQQSVYVLAQEILISNKSSVPSSVWKIF